MPDLTPAQLADFDRAHAAAQEDLDDLIATHRAKVAEVGAVQATAALANHLWRRQPHGVAASFAAHAITRLARDEPATEVTYQFRWEGEPMPSGPTDLGARTEEEHRDRPDRA